MASEKHTESVSRLNARIEELEAEIDLLQREVTATYQAYDDMMRCKDEDIAELRKQIEVAVLPEGVVWPRFEDGEPVGFGDLYVNADGNRSEVQYIGFKPNGFKVNKGQKRNEWKAYGEPVKRPEPEVLDADGVPIKVGDTLYNDRGTAFRVDRLKSLGNTIKLTCIKECAEFSLDPSTLTHQAPVLDADGVPIKVGDTVWYGDDCRCVVERIYRQNGDTLLDLYVCEAIWNWNNVKPAEVTHRKPDTQEAIDADATVPAAVYCVRHGLVESDSDVDDATLLERHILDLLARQRKLLGGE